MDWNGVSPKLSSGNCNLGDKIIYRLHEEQWCCDTVTLASSLPRASDGVPIAHLVVSKAKLAPGEAREPAAA